VANFIAVVVLTYTRAFRGGDRVRIGDVVEKTSFITRLRTPKNAEITIPNGVTLTSQIVNYSANARDRGLVLNPTVTIGYDVPAEQAERLLISAAAATEGIEAEPAPYVHQLSLQDAYVEYELNAVTRSAREMPKLYSELHRNIQRTFHEAGGEVASAHYLAIRDGNAAALPQQNLPTDYSPPSFRLGPFEFPRSS